MIIWCIFDIIISLLSMVIAFVLIFVVYREPEGSINVGWDSQYQSMIATICLFGLSILSRIPFIIFECIFSCKINNSCPSLYSSFNEITTHNLDRKFWVDFKLSAIIICSAFLLVSSGALFYSINSALNENYYILDSEEAGYSDCDPMITTICSLPFPSAYWVEPSTQTASGYQVRMGKGKIEWCEVWYNILYRIYMVYRVCRIYYRIYVVIVYHTSMHHLRVTSFLSFFLSFFLSCLLDRNFAVHEERDSSKPWECK
jgi:hypothetical protein